MKRLSICFLAIFALIATNAFAGSEWLPNFEDVPMMDKTYTIDDAGFVYSVPDGKIVTATVASDAVTRRQFQRFYRDALKELGWKNTRDDRHGQTFIRGTDELRIEIINPDPLSAQLTLTPRD